MIDLCVAEHTKLVVLGLFPKSARDGEQAGSGTGDGGISLIGTPFLVAKVCKRIGIHQVVGSKGSQLR